MSVTKKSIAFLALPFGASWLAAYVIWRSGVVVWVPPAHPRSALIGLFMLGMPGLSALICAIVFERGQRLKALGLGFRPNWWWLSAALIVLALTAMTVLITALFSPYSLVGIDDMARQLAASQHQHYANASAYLLRAIGAMGVSIVPYSIIYTLTEELGWRGYLYHLWRPYGFWRFSFAVGLIWGVWHWPLNLALGLSDPGHRLLSLLFYPLFTIPMAALMTLVRDRGRSVLAAGIMHGTLNAIGILPLIMVDAPKFPWWTDGGSGLGGVAAATIGALLITLFQRQDQYRDA